MRFLLPCSRTLAVCLFLPALGFSAETLRLRADSWMPYNGDPAAGPPGYAIEIARAIFEPAGIVVDYRTQPWSEALHAVAAGEIEAVIGANRQEAAGLVLPAEPIGLPRVGLFARKGSAAHYQNVPSLAQFRLGVVEAYSYWPALDAYIAKQTEPRVRRFSGDRPLADALAQLQRGELDLVAETASVFAWAAKQAGCETGTFHPVYLHEGDPVYFAFSPQHPDSRRYAARFDAGLRELRRSGELAKILARYGVTDWAADNGAGH